MGARDLLAGDVVDARAEPLGQPPRVGEHDRAVVRADEVDDPALDGRPDARALFGVGACRRDLVEAAHIFHRDHNAEVQLLARARLDDRHRAAAAQERCDLVERPDGRRKTDPLSRRREQLVQPLERKCEVRAALRAGDGVDLVDDDGIDVAEGVARLRRQEQEQRLGRADQDVRGSRQHPASVLRRRVAGPNPDDDRRELDPETRRGRLDAGQRNGGRGQPVDRPQESRKGLAGAGGRHDQGVLARGDGFPGAGLCLGGAVEGGPEPLPGRIGERKAGRHGPILPHGCDTRLRTIELGPRTHNRMTLLPLLTS